MKKILFLVLYLFAGNAFLTAQNADIILQEVSRLVKEEKHTEIIELLSDHQDILKDVNAQTRFTLLYLQGYAYRNLNQYSEAEKNYLEAKKIVEKIFGKEHLTYAFVLNDLGLLYYNTGDYAQAEKFYLEALTIKEKALGKEHPDYATSLNNLGNLYDDMGDYAQSEKYLLETLSIREKILGKEHPDYANSLNNLGALYYSIGDYAKTEKNYLEALTIREKNLGKEHPYYAASLNNLGVLYKSMGDYAKSEKFYLEALTIKEKVFGKEHPDYASSLNNLGNLYNDMGNYAQAEKFYLEALTIDEKVLGKEHPNYAGSLNNLGVLYKNMGDYALSEKNYLEALTIIDKVLGKEHPDYASSLKNLSLSYWDAGNFTQAQVTKIEADQLLVAQVEKNFSFLSERQRNLFWDSNKYALEATYSYVYQHPVPAMTEHSYNTALFTKGLLLRTTNGIRDAIYSSGDEDLIAKYEGLKTIRQQITALQAKETSDRHWIETLENSADSLEKALTATSSVYQELKADIAIKWQDIRNVLQDNEVAIEFVHFNLANKSKWTDTTFYCALIVKKGAETPIWVPLFEENQLQTLTKRERGSEDKNFVQQIYSGRKGANLYDMIWQPLDEALQNIDVIYYSPSGMLNQIAFAALPADGIGVVRLQDQYDMRLVSSTREIVRLKKETSEMRPQEMAVVYGGLHYEAEKDVLIAEAKNAAKTQNNDLLATAVLPQNVQRGGAWLFLKGSEVEAKQICAHLDSHKIPYSLYLGTAGNEESFKNLSGTNVGTIHLATHGFFLKDIENEDNRDIVQRLGGNDRKVFENPMLRSGVVLAGGDRAWTGEDVIEGIEDGILTADEIAQMNLIKTKLVVLSACETGLGEAKNSEGVFGLQRAFKLAGVETLIMSLWKVDDAATYQLMTTFYELYLSGKTKREAFTEAQRQLREAPDYKMPWFWAGFVMLD